MLGPFIYIGTYEIQPGKTEEARKRCSELVEFVETNEPRLIAFHLFLDEEGGRFTTLQVHPDAASMEFHLQVNTKHFATAYDYIGATVSEQIYGPTTPSLEAELSKWDAPDAPVTRMSDHLGGFTRTNVR